jgi:membrane protein DedA with SNARE-associated domain
MTVLGHLLDLIGRYGYLMVFFGVMLESAGMPLPGETVLITSGALAHRGVLDFGDAVIFGVLGAVGGDQVGYWVGRLAGRPFVLRWERHIVITPERFGRVEKTIFDRDGGRAVFLARFVTGLRVFEELVTGTSDMPWRRFALYNALGGAVWATAAISLDHFLWASIGVVEHWLGRASLLLIAAVALALLLRWVCRIATHEGEPRGDPLDPVNRSS